MNALFTSSAVTSQQVQQQSQQVKRLALVLELPFHQVFLQVHGITFVTAEAAPVVVGIIDSAAARARLKSECGKSRRLWSFV